MAAPGQTRHVLAWVLVLSAGTATAAGEPVVSDTQPFPPPEARRTPGAKEPPEVVALLRQRCDVAKAELDAARKSLGDPNLRTDQWAALAERVLIAETDAARTPEERVAAYREFRDHLKQMEERLKDVAEPARGQGYFEYGQKLWIRCRRLQADVSLARAELGKDEPAPADKEPPAMRAAVLAWRDGARQWANLWLQSRMLLIPPFAREIASTALTADLAAAQNPTDQIAAYQAYRDRLLAIEKDTKSEVERRRYNAFDYLRIKEMRCNADVVLGRLKAGADRTADPPEVRAALDDWAQTVAFEADINRKRFEPSKVPPEEGLVVDESLLREELAAATKPAERVAAYKKYLIRLKEAEASLKARAGDSPAAKEDAARATFSRAAAELTILQLTAAPGAPTSPEAKALLTEQRTCLRTELAQRMADWSAGRGDFQLLQESAGHLLLAELATAESPAERLAAYQAHADRMRTAEADAKSLVQAKKGAEVWLLWTRSARLEAEVWLLRAKTKLSAGSETRPAAGRS